jgi:hypothetical protein
MSYDFIIFRGKSELESLDDIEDPSRIGKGDWRNEALELLSAHIPGLAWTSRHGCLCASHPQPDIGRFDFMVMFSSDLTCVHVSGSHHANQVALVRSCAQAVGGYAFDMQTCKRVWPEPAHGT